VADDDGGGGDGDADYGDGELNKLHMFKPLTAVGVPESMT
jgi:hypothetical protein